ncbi:MAG: thioredoxin family protein [Puia sp.]|nr:thioredoxin family protein [Puia sp.]
MLFSVFISARGQESGIRFDSGLSWNEVRAKAMSEGKYIFLDCNATWCGPCKWMSNNIFPQKEVGYFVNAHFISVAVQMDRTSKDNHGVREWYVEADSLRQEFKIAEYPTYLFFSPEGQIVHKIIGATQNGEEFIAKAKNVLNPRKQYYTVLKNWKIHQEDSLYLFDALTAAIYTGSDEGPQILDTYFKLLKNPCTKENIKIFDRLMRTSRDKVFKLYLDSLSKIDQLMGADYAEETLCPIIFKDETADVFARKNGPIYWKQIISHLKQKYPGLGDQLTAKSEPLFQNKIRDEIVAYKDKNSFPPTDWVKIHKIISRKYPGYDFDLIFFRVKLDYCTRKKMQVERAKVAFMMMTKYSSILGDRNTNDLIWNDIFNVTGNTKILSKSLLWMKSSVTRISDNNNYDTYANLLYKTGNLIEAISWENKAIELAIKTKVKPDQLQEFEDNLDKMNKRQRTWSDDTPVPQFSDHQ